MGVLPRVFFSIPEVAARWGCAPADIAGWAHQGQLEIVTGIVPVECEGGTYAGLVAISAADITPMFRRSGTGPREMPVRRIKRPGEADWQLITDPAEGVMVSIEDLHITATEVARFEAEYEIFGKPRSSGGGGGGKFEPRYDWDAFWRAVVFRVHHKGVPETLKEFVDEFESWFMDQSPTGDCPSDSVIRKRLSPLWRTLRQDF